MPLAINGGMKRTIFLTISVLLLTAAPIWAQRGGSPKPKTTHAAPGPKMKTHVPSPHRGSTTRGGSAVKPGKTTRVASHAPSKATAGASSVKTAKTAKASRTTTTVPGSTTLTPVQLKLQKNPNLASKLQSRLPAGTNLTRAASGFRNLGQFVAAVNASHNHGIPFAQLKTRMVDQGMSLGQAMQATRSQKQ